MDAVHWRVEDYYEDSVTLLCLLVMSGNFWQPGALFVDDFESGDTSSWSGTVRGFEALGAPGSPRGNRR